MGVIMKGFDEDLFVAKVIGASIFPFLVPMVVYFLAMEKVWEVYDKIFGKS